MLFEPGDILFYSKSAGSSEFSTAVENVVKDNLLFHIAILSDIGSIIEATTVDGVVEIENIWKSLDDHLPGCLEVCRIKDVNQEQRSRAAKFARSKIGKEYNDLFASDLINSDGKESYYCSQLITECYENVSWPQHSLNFKNANGELNEYWREYFEKRGKRVPQGEDGSHPAQLRKYEQLELIMRIVPGGITLKTLKNSRIFDCPHWISGNSVELSSDRSFDVIEPRSGKILTKWNYATDEHVNYTVGIAQEAQKVWANTGWIEKSNVLRKTAELLKTHCDEIAYWECIDNGKPLYEAKADVLSCVDTFTFYSGIAHDLLGRHIPIDSSRFAYTKKVPVGVVASIGAWNYPIQTCTWKTAPALACGNSVIYKPSPLSPVSALILGAILKEAGLPDGAFNVLQGDAQTATSLIEHEGVTKVSFTGSIPTGKKIMKACAERNIKPLTLELGGKSALIVFDDADLDTAVSCAMIANFYSQGQVCSNASKVLVHESLMEEFTRRLVEKTKNMKVGDPLDEGTTKVGAHISEEHRDRVEQYIEGAVSEGATRVYGGERVIVENLEGGYYLSPCILSNITTQMKVYHEEIFGSVLLIIPFADEDEAIRLANDTKMGLAAGIVTQNLEKSHRIVDRLNAGNVYVNTYNDVSPLVPFGGFGESGFGRENGIAVLEHYTQIKSVFVNTSKCENPF